MQKHGLLKVHGLPLTEILPGGRLFGADEIWFTSCTSDVHQCHEGDLYVAILGESDDGHLKVNEAIEQGASAIVTERLIPAQSVPQYIVADTRIAYANMCHAISGFPSRRLNVVGVAGSEGKTTTTCLIQSIIRSAGLQSGILNGLGYCDGAKTVPSEAATPGPAVFADYLARMRAGGCSHAVVELEDRAIVGKRTAGVELDVACITACRGADSSASEGNESEDSVDAIPSRIFEQLRPEGLVVLNADDPTCRMLEEELHHPVLTFGLEQPAVLTATLLERVASEQTFLIHWGNETIPVRTHMIGDHHIYDCLAAAAVGLAYGIELETIVRGIERVDRMPGHLERIECGQPFSLFVDSGYTPAAVGSALQALRETTRGKLICVFGAPGERDRDLRSQLGAAVAEWADQLIITDGNPAREDSMQIAGDILQGISDTCDPRVELDRASAIEIALATAEAGDCVLIAGRGHQSWQLIGTRRFPFDDRDVARRCLQSGRWGSSLGGEKRAA
ncbi:MAG: UDP-N-acetylmuramoyl-L-alanyl-D-glutamate--2,6-diaminopimelate ligase [Pirellulales bacterium]|nr:UDP-N-acetylmuramoyl-L-alanyl-D-glutamate--2,6-diaminopimelate ligase [Pirellulales bacterium]